MISLALKNLGRRKTRTALLVSAVALSSAITFASAILIRSVDASMAVGFSRLGADLLVVPAQALTNITAALLTAEPTDGVLPADLMDRAGLAGIESAAPQRVFRTTQSGLGGAGESVDLIGFDPRRDFTVQPWISERLARAMQPGDVILGSARDNPVGSEIVLFGKPFRVFARLGRTGVGTHERGVFMSSASLVELAEAVRGRTGARPQMLDPANVSGFLVKLAPGSTELQVRFALLSRAPEAAVVGGESLLTGIRQGLSALLGGTLAIIAAMSVSTAVLVGVLFSAIVAERRGELGVLKAIGARRRQLVGVMVLEAMLATGAGGVVGVAIGVLLLRLFERSVVFHLVKLDVPFLWLSGPQTVIWAIACVIAAAVIGAAGALAPAWRASRRDAYDLIRGES
jgi:putative ABC transport system permease protein